MNEEELFGLDAETTEKLLKYPDPDRDRKLKPRTIKQTTTMFSRYPLDWEQIMNTAMRGWITDHGFDYQPEYMRIRVGFSTFRVIVTVTDELRPTDEDDD